jgi:hypothetical protein
MRLPDSNDRSAKGGLSNDKFLFLPLYLLRKLACRFLGVSHCGFERPDMGRNFPDQLVVSCATASAVSTRPELVEEFGCKWSCPCLTGQSAIALGLG